MSLELVLIDLITLAIVGYGFFSLPAGKTRWYFAISILLMALYKVYDPDTQARSLLWLRHLPVYAGEAVFYYFIVAFSRRYIEIDEPTQKSPSVLLQQNVLVLGPAVFFASGVAWFQIVTDQGLAHILTLPLFVLVISLVRLRLAVYESRFSAIVALFTAAIGCWIMIHVSEFMVESQKVVPGLDRYMAHIEFFWFCAGSATIAYTIRKFKDMQRVPKA